MLQLTMNQAAISLPRRHMTWPLPDSSIYAPSFPMGSLRAKTGTNNKVVVVMGATGTGKSKLAIDLARRLGGEVVNSDKMQVYDGLDVVTNKVTEEECMGVPHHLINGVHPDSDFSASNFREHASRAVDSIANRGLLPIIAGGSSSYIEELIEGADGLFKSRGFNVYICTVDTAFYKRIGAATALEVRATGIPYTFSPCIAVCRDPRWGRCYESFGEDPRLVQNMTEIITGLQGDLPPNYHKGTPYVAGKRNVAACAKHFVVDGGTQNGINENNTVTSLRGLLSIHMPPYYSAIAKGVSTIMVSYSSWNGVKMHANRFLITDYLKNRLHFKGFVISDYTGIDKITTQAHADYPYSVKLSILAGIDMVHHDVAREAVRKSLVLLKNGKYGEKPLLPLPKKSGKILVAGAHADNLGYQCGSWTITWQGQGGNNITSGTKILEGIKSTVDPSTEVIYAENPTSNFIKQNYFSYAIVITGELPYTETVGGNLNLTIPDPGLTIIQNTCRNVKCVVVLISGWPLVIEPYIGIIDAFVAAWLPGTEGQGVADMLFGDYGFSGKLSRTWFKSVDQLPMNVGDPHYDPLFPFGFGLETRPVHG